MHKGNVSQIFHDKEYGRIKAEDGTDIHFHKYCLWDVDFSELTEGQKVEFEVQPSRHGYLAFHIRPYV